MHSRSLVNLKIDGPQKLKYLELRYCFSLQNLEILATNLISFKYHGPYMINNPVKNVPLLSEVSIGGCYCTDLVCLTFYCFSGVLSQLETLVLDLDSLVSLHNHCVVVLFLVLYSHYYICT
ncbi:hypothetical protein CsSME_00031805 [Camellia sinensis var. sinensis]